MIKSMRRLDKNERKYIGDVMTNFDHSIDYELAPQLIGENSYASYPAWDFHGSVWHEEGQYHCEIWQYRSYQETISAETLGEIMDIVSGEYGSE